MRGMIKKIQRFPILLLALLTASGQVKGSASISSQGGDSRPKGPFVELWLVKNNNKKQPDPFLVSVNSKTLTMLQQMSGGTSIYFDKLLELIRKKST